MWLYSWKSATFDVNVEKFSNLNEVCFSFEKPFCDIENCYHPTFICCSHCRDVLCMHHFFTEYHYHNDYDN